MLALTKELTNLKTAIHLPSGVDGAVLRSVIERVESLQNHLRSLRNSVSEQFTCHVQSCVQNAIAHIPSKDIKVEFEPSIQPGVLARIRTVELSQILENLLDNSIRALCNSPEKRITIDLHANADFVFINIADTGMGIPQEIQAKLFEQHISTKSKSGGFGLFHARQVVVKYGGNIRLVESNVGHGTIFEVQLKRVDNA